MREPFLDFEWRVFPTYHWQDWLDERGRPVVARDHGVASLESPGAVELAWQERGDKQEIAGPLLGPVPDSGKAQQYQPMERKHAALFRTFEALDFQDKGAIIAFASSYGLLGVEQREQGPLSSKYGGHYASGESHLTWAHEICQMREAMRLVRPRSRQQEAEVDARYKKYKLDPERHRKKDRERLESLFNAHLQHVQPRMAFQRDIPPRLSFAPRTLAAAMWLQLALAIVDDKQFQTCKFCRRFFEISTSQTGYRTHREFCSDSCKTKDYRRRKRTALRLMGKGQPLREVAKQSNTEVATIRKWKAIKPRPKLMKGDA